MLIHILMATYNGGEYLPEQLASLEGQTISDWKLHVRDDCSTDGTWKVLTDFSRRNPGKVDLAQNQSQLGAKGNYAELLREVQEPGDYVFCDQDDIWEPQKLFSLQKELREAERGVAASGSSPALVYSDAMVVDERGREVAPSFVGQAGVSLPESRVMETLLLCNFVQGAAAMWNEGLQRILGEAPMPEEALMHDWWVALVAAGHGVIRYLPERLSRYRQHGNNVVGGFDRSEWHRTVRKKVFGGKIKRLTESNHQMRRDRKRQAEAYWRLFGDRRAGRYLEIEAMRPKIRRAYRGIREGYVFLSVLYSMKYYLL